MSWALIFFIYVQGAQTLVPYVDRLEIAPQRLESAQACDTAGKMLSGPLLAETDPLRQYAWRGYQCVDLEGSPRAE